MANITDPTEDEISFLRKLYDRDGELTLQGNIGLLKVERLGRLGIPRAWNTLPERRVEPLLCQLLGLGR